MKTTAVEKELFPNFEKDFQNNRLQVIIEPSLNRFQKILKSYIAFNALFFILILAELIYFSFHLAFFVQTFVLAIHLTLIFITVFAYLTLRLYFQTKKTERCLQLKAEFIDASQKALHYQEGNPESYLVLASACCKFAADLHGKEYNLYQSPIEIDPLSFFLEKISCRFHWHDVHFMKEIMLQAAVEEHIKLVKMEPTSLEAHAGLANAYVMLSGLYIDPRTVEGLENDGWIPPNKFTSAFKQKFRWTAERAIEEFKILSDYAPNDPWVHSQLAFSYRDLQMPKEEIQQYEIIQQLCPDDKENLCKLGKLYFQQGLNAKGLKVYEELKNGNYKKAETLIHYYGIYANGEGSKSSFKEEFN
jgi:tetratricopeptide (TPR) repeat protein